MRSIFDFKHYNTTLLVRDSDVTIDVYTDGGYLYVRVFEGDTLVNHLDITNHDLFDIDGLNKKLYSTVAF
jgi:hypothetical protein